ncbi:RabGAP TBC [Clavulina sp. PMI_390]|nr:RabGAP TBC [Clavulina sp. PMI_390]
MSDFAAPRPAPVPGYSPNGSLAFPGGAALTEEAAKAKADMYRQLELKWIAVMNAVPSAEAGKSRKVRKLVIDGIPASVRGVVWLYLTDNKGRRMPGVYGQLSRRKVAATKEIWADVQTRFPDQPHLCEAEGPIMSILQAYLSMVPDTIYSYGLALIAGNLLLQTHDEDAFWTFVAIMDRHLRGYFSPTARLLEIDSILFERAVISSDKALAARLFDDFRVPAAEFCSHWFTTIFACALPPSYLPRIWDTIMFFSDPTFILRLGLAMLKLCRPFIMDAARCHSGEDARNYLIRPPLTVFPKDPDSILSIAFSLKMKEDELKKLRPKVEAQLKQRHPLRAPSGSMRS